MFQRRTAHLVMENKKHTPLCKNLKLYTVNAAGGSMCLMCGKTKRRKLTKIKTSIFTSLTFWRYIKKNVMYLQHTEFISSFKCSKNILTVNCQKINTLKSITKRLTSSQTHRAVQWVSALCLAVQPITLLSHCSLCFYFITPQCLI